MAFRDTGNRLAREKSPYLLQHARNPVDWYPWGDKAFERAKTENKPVFLSVGYSTCHWCHVMERESFGDKETARLLNRAFICVKVDREERPDLDQYFMAVCQALTGSGGWPLTVVMTPDKKPFFAGTYFPKKRRWGRDGLMEIVPRIQTLWETRREEIVRSAGEVSRLVLSRRSSGAESGGPSAAVLNEALRGLSADFDDIHGGFGVAPKFPAPHNLAFLLRMWGRTGREEALGMVERTLLAMRHGGIFDQLGFGFHRYSTDAHWLVPHFEKMLYDQALLAHVYTEAYQATGRGDFRRTALETLDYVLRDMTSPEGGFYSAEDADSEGEEGLFYLWTEDEIRSVLGDHDASIALEAYNIRSGGNFSEPRQGPNGRNILHLTFPRAAESPPNGLRTGMRPAGRPDSPEAHGAGLELDPFDERMDRIRASLFEARKKKARPFKDTKILADWNGLAVAAFAAAARIADRSRYLKAAKNAARFILDGMRDSRGRLFHVHSEGEARVPGFLDDYAFLAHGLIELHQTTFDPVYLKEALALTEAAKSLFEDSQNGGFFFVPPDSELPVRNKELYDSAIPSGNAMMLLNLVRLARLTGRADLEVKASGLVSAVYAKIGPNPRAHAAILCGLDLAFGPTHEVVIVGQAGDPRTRELIEVLQRGYLPNVLGLFKPDGEKAPAVVEIAPFTEPMTPAEGRPVAYVCTGGRCLKPVRSAEELAGVLAGLG